MQAEKQHTLSRAVEFAGVGLHSGEQTRICLHPANPGHGVIFRRQDLEPGPDTDNFIAATPSNVAFTQLGTTISNVSGVSVSTIEHLMAALALCNIDNVLIDVFGAEIPILDGSAAPFVEKIRAAGSEMQAALRQTIEITEPFFVEDGDRMISIEPLDHWRLDIAIEFEDCLIGRQSLTARLDDINDLERLASSRTFCRLHEIEQMRAAGLIRGGSLDCAIVVDGERILNSETLRDPNEFALHKALDLIGDLYLLGGPIKGHIHANKPGHDLNTKFARALASHLGIEQAQSLSEPGLMAATA